MASTTTNYVSSRDFMRLAEKIRTLQEQSALFREMFRKAGPGRYDGATVYKVKGHQVRAHWRDGWTAVRVKKPAALVPKP